MKPIVPYLIVWFLICFSDLIFKYMNLFYSNHEVYAEIMFELFNPLLELFCSIMFWPNSVPTCWVISIEKAVSILHMLILISSCCSTVGSCCPVLVLVLLCYFPALTWRHFFFIGKKKFYWKMISMKKHKVHDGEQVEKRCKNKQTNTKLY